MGDYTPALSGLTVGSYLNAMLYMLEIVQLTSYIKHFWRKDKFVIKSVVILCFIVDTLCTIAIFSWVMLCDVIHWGDIPYLDKQYWPTPTYVFCSAIVGALVQSFLISRYYILSSQRIVSAILGFFVFAAFVGGVAVAIINLFFVSYADRDKPMITSMIWLISASLADIFIAVMLVLTFLRVSSGNTIRSTQTLIQRLIFVAVQSGTVPTILALLVLTTYLTKPTTNDSAYFSFCLGRVYTLTMLFNLNVRKYLETGCHICGLQTVGVTLPSGEPGGDVSGITRPTVASNEVCGLSETQDYQAGSRLRLDGKEQRPFGGREYRYCKSSGSDHALDSPNTV